MPKNEEGEFELILGNRQLLSVFFIVVVLLGVFFTMGYIVGRNSSPVPSVDTARKTESAPIVVERASPGGAAAENPPAASAPVETPAPATPPPVATTKSAEPPPPVAKSAPKSDPKPEPASPTPNVPTPGLQLAAIGKPEAQVWVDVLAKKGFRALYAPVPEKSTFRVLVGPYPDAAAISEARGELTKAGFKGYEAIVRKY